MSRMHRSSRIMLLLGLAFTTPAAAAAQVPERFTNLQVLPDTISRSALTAQMRGFSFALGVRCSYCHAVSDALNQPSDDFAADTKPTKARAREMMRMVRDLNDVYLARLPERRTPNVGVACATCHGGVPRPEALNDLLHRVATARGIDSAMATYASLREEFFGSRAYDFGSRTMFQLAAQLVTEGRHRDAIPVYRRILEDEPRSTEAMLNLGAAHVAVADTAEAIRVYQRAVEVDSAGFFGTTAARRIAALRRQP